MAHHPRGTSTRITDSETLDGPATMRAQYDAHLWLQGIWLPLHGYSFERTPLWAGIC
jgi:hypothetical protein